MGREQGHKYRFFGLRSLLENRFPQPQLSRILLVYCKIIPGKLGFAQMDDLVGPINEHINLSPRQGIIPPEFPRTLSGIHPTDAQCCFYLVDVHHTDILEGVSAPSPVAALLRQLLPYFISRPLVGFNEFKIK